MCVVTAERGGCGDPPRKHLGLCSIVPAGVPCRKGAAHLYGFDRNPAAAGPPLLHYRARRGSVGLSPYAPSHDPRDNAPARRGRAAALLRRRPGPAPRPWLGAVATAAARWGLTRSTPNDAHKPRRGTRRSVPCAGWPAVGPTFRTNRTSSLPLAISPHRRCILFALAEWWYLESSL